MKIGIYKPYFPALFGDDKNDMNATSYEVTNVAKIFAKFGHEVHILSKTDLEKHNHIKKDILFGRIEKNKSLGSIQKGSIDDKFDRIILYGGPWHLENEEYIPVKLREQTERLDFLLTDIRVMPHKEWMMGLFDNFYSQSTNDELFGWKTKYGGVAEFRCYQMKLEKPTLQTIKDKGIHMYFGGTTRNRLEKYKEYIWNHKNDWVITGKSEQLGFNNRVTRDMFLEMLHQSKYSLTFVDVDYEENNFITPRHYENIENNIVGFADVDWDKGEQIMRADDWRRVKNFKELYTKIRSLDREPRKHLELLKAQHKEIKPEFIDGSYVYKCLDGE